MKFHCTFELQCEESDFNSFLASGNFCRLLITFANILDPDQAQQWAWSGSKMFDILMVFLKDFFEKKKKKKSTEDRKACKIIQHAKS